MRWTRLLWTLLCIAGPAAGAEHAVPVDNLAQAISTRAGIVAAGGELHFRGPGDAGPRSALASGTTPRGQRDSAAAADRRPAADPLPVVIALFRAFTARDADGWVRDMAPDYRFDSDERSFLAHFPRGFGHDDEAAFVTHLFRGGARRADGTALPVAVAISDEQGPLWVEARAIDGTRAIAHVRRYGPVVTFSDSTHLTLGGSDNELELRREDGRWWIVAWHEHATGEPDAGTMTAARDSAAGTGGTASVSRTVSGAAAAAPPRLMTRALPGHGGELTFALELPAAGGELELFDVMGRRLARRDLSALAAGVHRVALPGGIPAGVYWARLRQGGTATSARVSVLP